MQNKMKIYEKWKTYYNQKLEKKIESNRSTEFQDVESNYPTIWLSSPFWKFTAGFNTINLAIINNDKQ